MKRVFSLGAGCPVNACALWALLPGACLAFMAGCHRAEPVAADYVVTLPPLQMILEPLVEGRKTVACLVPPGSSPHTFDLRPSGAKQLSDAQGVFYVDESLDGWAARLAPGKTHEVFAMVPAAMRLPYDIDHNHGEDTAGPGANPHFWSDPHVVAAVVPALVKILVEADPAGQSLYEANAAAFIERLTLLDKSLQDEIGRMPSMTLVAFHPSWSYFFHRYGMTVAAYVEPIPGKELTPQAIVELRRQLEHVGPVVVLSEVQLPRRSADALAEALGAQMIEIDPLGGRPPVDRYESLIESNAARLQEAPR